MRWCRAPFFHPPEVEEAAVLMVVDEGSSCRKGEGAREERGLKVEAASLRGFDASRLSRGCERVDLSGWPAMSSAALTSVRGEGMARLTCTAQEGRKPVRGGRCSGAGYIGNRPSTLLPFERSSRLLFLRVTRSVHMPEPSEWRELPRASCVPYQEPDRWSRRRMCEAPSFGCLLCFLRSSSLSRL